MLSFNPFGFISDEHCPHFGECSSLILSQSFFLQLKIVNIHDDNNNDVGDGLDDVNMKTEGSHHLNIYKNL